MSGNTWRKFICIRTAKLLEIASNLQFPETLQSLYNDSTIYTAICHHIRLNRHIKDTTVQTIFHISQKEHTTWVLLGTSFRGDAKSIHKIFVIRNKKNCLLIIQVTLLYSKLCIYIISCFMLWALDRFFDVFQTTNQNINFKVT